MKELKQKLLNVGVFIDNEWLDKYVNLIESNRSTKQLAFTTQSHHIIPKCYYKLNNLQVDNSKDNRVNLVFVDHALAHLYIANCVNDSKLKHRNMKAVDHVIGNKNFKLNDSYEIERELIVNSSLYNDTYAKTKEYWSKTCNFHNPNTQSFEQRRANGLQNKDRKYIRKGDKVKAVRLYELEDYLADGWVLGNRNKEIFSGRRAMTKDGVSIIYAKEDDIEMRLAEGYVFGKKLGIKHRIRKRRD